MFTVQDIHVLVTIGVVCLFSMHNIHTYIYVLFTIYDQYVYVQCKYRMYLLAYVHRTVSSFVYHYYVLTPWPFTGLCSGVH